MCQSPNASPAWRLPARAIEQVVIDGLRNFLHDKARLS
jgi:hypothetical protein